MKKLMKIVGVFFFASVLLTSCSDSTDIRGFYKNGLKIGEWKFFDEKGILDTIITQ